MLIVLDRANSAALAVPAILWFAVEFHNGNHRRAAIAVALGMLFRPQLAALAIGFLARRRLRPFLSAVGLGSAGLLLSFVTYPGDPAHNVGK